MGEGQEKNIQQHTSHQTSKQVIGGIVVIIVGIIIVGKSSQVFATNHAIKQPLETQSHQDYGTTFVMESLPSDPREDLFIKLDNEDITGLIENSMLRMGLALSQMMGWTFGYVDPSLLQRRSFPTSFSKWGCRMRLESEVMPHHHVQHMQNMGLNLFVCNENSAYVMPCVTACAVTSCTHCVAYARRQAGHPMYTWHARNYLWTCCSCQPSDIY